MMYTQPDCTCVSNLLSKQRVAELFYPRITHLQYTNSLQKCGNTTFPNKLVLQVGCTEAVGFHSNPDTGLKGS